MWKIDVDNIVNYFNLIIWKSVLRLYNKMAMLFSFLLRPKIERTVVLINIAPALHHIWNWFELFLQKIGELIK